MDYFCDKLREGEGKLTRLHGIPGDGVRGDGLVTQTIDLAGGELRILQPAESAGLPDDGGVEWAPLLPYWSVLWRSGVALARELDGQDLSGKRLVELGCGLGLPSIVAAGAGASVLATDVEEEGLELTERNAQLNGVRLETAAIDWAHPEPLLDHAPFDLAIAADVLYEHDSVAPLLELLPKLAPEALIADPGREPAKGFFEQLVGSVVESRRDGVVTIRRLRLN